MREKKYGCCRRTCIWVNKTLNSILACILIVFDAIGICIKSIFGCFRTAEIKEDKFEEEIQTNKKSRIPPHIARKRLKDASWTEVVGTVTSGIKDGLEEYKKKNDEPEHEFSVKYSNIISIVNEIYGTYIVCSLAFSAEVGWNIPDITTELLSYFRISPSSTKVFS